MWPHWLLLKDLPKNSNIQLMTIRWSVPPAPLHPVVPLFYILSDIENAEPLKNVTFLSSCQNG
jgi:hypothetical protein